MAAALADTVEQVKLDILYNVTTNILVTVTSELIIEECRRSNLDYMLWVPDEKATSTALRAAAPASQPVTVALMGVRSALCTVSTDRRQATVLVLRRHIPTRCAMLS